MRKQTSALILAVTLAAMFGVRLWGHESRATLARPQSQPLLDKYGGLAQVSCANKTGHFILTKVGRRWYFCDALGHAFISMSVGNVVPNEKSTRDCNGAETYPIYAAKYAYGTDIAGTGYNWGWQTLKRLTSWRFNSLGMDSTVSSTFPWTICSGKGCNWPGGRAASQPVPVPIIIELKPSLNASVNRNGYLTSPVKDVLSGVNGNYRGWRGGALYDVFDPGLNREFRDELANTNGTFTRQIRGDDPYILGVLTDDQDYFWGAGAGPDFITAPGGHTNGNIAWFTLLTAPVRTFVRSTQFMNRSFLYSDPVVHMKADAKSPSTTCSISSPCSLRDYLRQRYTKGPIPSCAKASTGIAALNACWGSNYTTFDSTGKQVTGETIGAGNGSTRTFTHTLAHSPVSPFTVLISVAGTPQIGDCPWFDTSSGCPAVTANTGALGSPTANYIIPSTSDINYSTGVVTLDFSSAPASGAAITVNYIYGGWMARGTGLMDESGGTGKTTGCPKSSNSTCWVGTNPFCIEGANPNYPAYFSCTGNSGYNQISNTNVNTGADLNNWVSQFAAKYFRTYRDDLKAVSNIPYMGLDAVGNWGSVAISNFLQGMGPYVDVALLGNLAPFTGTGTTANFQARISYTTRYLGDVPFINWGVISAEADSSMSCKRTQAISGADFPTQAARGEGWYKWVTALLSTAGFNRDYQVVGIDWWSWQDFQNWNQGLVSIHDNAYDGHEDVTGTVPCSPPLQTFSCGGETANYGDAISRIRAANLLWLSLPSENAPTDHPARKE